MLEKKQYCSPKKMKVVINDSPSCCCDPVWLSSIKQKMSCCFHAVKWDVFLPLISQLFLLERSEIKWGVSFLLWVCWPSQVSPRVSEELSQLLKIYNDTTSVIKVKAFFYFTYRFLGDPSEMKLKHSSLAIKEQSLSNSRTQNCKHGSWWEEKRCRITKNL